MFHVSIWGAWRFFGGLSPPKPPRGDGTGCTFVWTYGGGKASGTETVEHFKRSQISEKQAQKSFFKVSFPFTIDPCLMWMMACNSFDRCERQLEIKYSLPISFLKTISWRVEPVSMPFWNQIYIISYLTDLATAEFPKEIGEPALQKYACL